MVVLMDKNLAGKSVEMMVAQMAGSQAVLLVENLVVLWVVLMVGRLVELQVVQRVENQVVSMVVMLVELMVELQDVNQAVLQVENLDVLWVVLMDLMKVELKAKQMEKLVLKRVDQKVCHQVLQQVELLAELLDRCLAGKMVVLLDSQRGLQVQKLVKMSGLYSEHWSELQMGLWLEQLMVYQKVQHLEYSMDLRDEMMAVKRVYHLVVHQERMKVAMKK